MLYKTVQIKFQNNLIEQTSYLEEKMLSLLQRVGKGTMSVTAYDTAWLARLYENPAMKPMADSALGWVRKNQLSDGSWGTAVPVYHHDRVICTLIALIALAERKQAQDNARIDLGLKALKYHQSKLHEDLAGETIAFEMLIPTLYKELGYYELVSEEEASLVERMTAEREAKLARTPGNMISRHVTMAFSSEMAGSDGLHILNTADLQESNGSVAHSPSATAYYLRNINPSDVKAIAYLKESFSDDGVPNVAPFDVFEAAWTLWNFSLLNWQTPETEAITDPLLTFLQNNWDPQIGIGHAAGYTPKDGDDTGFIFETLARYGWVPNIEPIFHYEKEHYFKCFALESNPSVSTNIHILGALLHGKRPLSDPSVKKVLNFLKTNMHVDGFWVDKWHISPYYVTSHMLITCANHFDDVIQKAIHWMINTQKKDGSWGVFHGTAEETAYSLQALVTCKQKGFTIPKECIEAGYKWLLNHHEDPLPPLWIGKCLYTPTLVVQATILSALLLCKSI